MKNFLYSLPFSILFALSLYYGFFVNIEGARNIAEFLIWVEFVVIIIALVSDYYSDKTFKPIHTIHRIFVAVFSVSVLLFLVWGGHMVLATVYLISKILIIAIRTPN